VRDGADEQQARRAGAISVAHAREAQAYGGIGHDAVYRGPGWRGLVCPQRFNAKGQVGRWRRFTVSADRVFGLG
jgi:hypothetical protein